MEEISVGIRQLIAEKLGFDETGVSEQSLFSQDLGADSLDIYELFHEAEKRFNVTLPMNKLKRF